MKWLFGGIFGISMAAFIVVMVTMKKNKKQSDELDRTFAMAEAALSEQEKMLRKQIEQNKKEQEKTTDEIKELVEEVNRLMADMGFDQKIMSVDGI